MRGPDRRQHPREEAANDFLATKQSALFTGPDAFFAKMGSDAIKAASGTLGTLNEAKDDLMDGLGNVAQRQRAGSMLDAQMRLTRDDVVRHVSDQYLAWQRQTAQNRIDGLTREAVLHYNDDSRLDAMAGAAALAARAKARVGDQPPDSDTENASADLARSGVLNSAIQARLDAGNTSGASDLYDRVKDQLDPAHAGPLGAQIETAQRFQSAKDYADGVMPETPGTTPDEIEAQRATATQQNQADNTGDPGHLRLAQHFIDVGFDSRQNDLQQAEAARDDAVTKWITMPTAEGKPQTDLPPPELWNQLNTNEQGTVLARLRQNALGPTGAVPVRYSPDQDPDAGEQIAQAPGEKPKDDPLHDLKKALHEETPEERYEHGEAPLEIAPRPPIGLPGMGTGGGRGTALNGNSQARPSGNTQQESPKPLVEAPRAEGSKRPPILQKPQGIPDDWIETPAERYGGVIYYNPQNRHDNVRVMPGNPDSPFPMHQRPYVKDQRNGRFVDKDGEPITGVPAPGVTPEAHIPYDEFVFRR